MFRKIVVQTIYFNFTEEMVTEFVARLNTAGEFQIDQKFLEGKTVTYRANDPASDAVAVTTYKLETQGMFRNE